MPGSNAIFFFNFKYTPNKVNVMAIVWKTIGELWGYPICTVAVAPSRYIFSLLNEVKEFMVKVPSPQIENAISIAGRSSGRDTDKIAELGLTFDERKSTLNSWSI